MATGSISSFLSSFTEELPTPNHFDVTINIPPASSAAGNKIRLQINSNINLGGVAQRIAVNPDANI